MITRKQARDIAFKLIFEYLFLSEINDVTYNNLTSVEMAKAESDYIGTVYAGVVEQHSVIMKEIEELSKAFTSERIFKIDLAALLLGIYEMRFMNDIPLSVSINEAVELVKTYSTEKSNQFVNGILSSVYKSIKHISNDKYTAVVADVKYENDKIDEVTNDVVSAENNVEEVTNDVATAENNIEEVTNDVVTAENSIEEVTNDVVTAENSIDEIINKVVVDERVFEEKLNIDDEINDSNGDFDDV